MRHFDRIILGIWGLTLFSCGGFYQPGVLREKIQAGEVDLSLPSGQRPSATDSQSWEVEPGIRLHHFEKGNGRAVLVVHGGPGIAPKSPWTGLEDLTGAYRFIYYHQRGSGLSTRPVDRWPGQDFYNNMRSLDRSLGLSTQITDIERIRIILGEEKLTIIGHSYGGFLATLYAVEFPERVDKLILIAPAGVLRLPPPEGGLYEAVKSLLTDAGDRGRYEAWLTEFFDFQGLWKKDEASLSELQSRFVPFWGKASATLAPSWGGSAAGEEERPGGWMPMAVFLSAGGSYDFRPSLRRVKAPVLILVGDRDLASRGEALGDYDGLPGAQKVILPGAGHFPFLAREAIFTRALEDFLHE